jgi:predicted RNase H-like HicB family nuclease
MTYKVELIHTEDGYVAGCPELPGCKSHGETEEETLENIRGAIGDYLAVAPRNDVPKKVRFIEIPEPSPVTASHEIPTEEPFKVKPIFLGLPPEWTSHKVEDLLDILEGHDRRW